MSALTSNDIRLLGLALAQGKPAQEVIPDMIGGLEIEDGILSLFARQSPIGIGLMRWNDPSFWRASWTDIPVNVFFFGEDVWGNQLAYMSSDKNVYLWSHEDGSLASSNLSLVDFLDSVVTHGVSWLDWYTSEMIRIGIRLSPGHSSIYHLHWKTPLILGGKVSIENLTSVERANHLAGHGELWKRISNLPLGTEVVIK